MAPRVADAAASVKYQKPHATPGKVVTDSQAGLAGANHDHVEVLVRGSTHISQLPMGLPPLGLPGVSVDRTPLGPVRSSKGVHDTPPPPPG